MIYTLFNLYTCMIKMYMNACRQSKRRAANTWANQRTLYETTGADANWSHEKIESNPLQGMLPDMIDVLLFLITSMIYLLLLMKQVSVSAKLYEFIHFLWLNEAPVGELQ